MRFFFFFRIYFNIPYILNIMYMQEAEGYHPAALVEAEAGGAATAEEDRTAAWAAATAAEAGGTTT